MKITNSLEILEGIPVIEGSRISVEWIYELSRCLTLTG